ncbi:MAG: hypothetical protein KGS45_00400 [Planctomycetes bacterium]|nr:hypothetical protein [Planctomycetota bacterium]
MFAFSLSRSCVTLVVLAGLACAPALAWDDPAVLSGPKVGDAAGGTLSLVEKDFDGKIKMLEVRPEVAGLKLLKLSDAEKAATDKILQEREAMVAKVLKENYALFLELQNLRQAGLGGGGGGEGGDREKAREEHRGMMEKMQTFREKAKDLLEPTLMDRLGKELTNPNATQLKRLVQEYNTAALEAQRAERGAGRPNAGGGVGGPPADGPMGEPAGRSARSGGVGGAGGELAARRMEINQTLREIGRSLRATVEDRKDRADAILKAANATPEQEAQIRAIFREMGTKVATGTPSEAERGAAMRKVMEILTPEQREAVMKELRR